MEGLPSVKSRSNIWGEFFLLISEVSLFPDFPNLFILSAADVAVRQQDYKQGKHFSPYTPSRNWKPIEISIDCCVIHGNEAFVIK